MRYAERWDHRRQWAQAQARAFVDGFARWDFLPWLARWEEVQQRPALNTRVVGWALVALGAAARADEPCPICYEPHTGVEVVQTICKHVFCVPCWEENRAMKQRSGFDVRCPMCFGLAE